MYIVISFYFLVLFSLVMHANVVARFNGTWKKGLNAALIQNMGSGTPKHTQRSCRVIPLGKFTSEVLAMILAILQYVHFVSFKSVLLPGLY